jgi:tetratricopeptide (TPR) repeat protein
LRQTIRLARFLTLLAATVWAALAQESAGAFAELSAQASRARDANEAASAIRLYKEALQLNPNWQEGWWMAGSLQYDSEQYAESAASLRRLTALRQGMGPAWGLLGLCEYETGSYRSAFEDIQRSLALGIGDQPQMTGVLKFHEALLLTKKGEFDTALQKYSAFLPPTVKDPQVLLGLGLTALRRRQVPKEVSADHADLVSSAGRALAAFLMGDYSRAQALYDQLLARFPNDPDVHYAYGYSVLRADPERAIQEWERALSIDPSNAAAHAMLSWTFSLRDQREKALAHAREAVAKDPNITVSQVVLGRLLVQKGQIDAGIEHLERAVQIDSTNLEAHLALATAYSEAGRKEDSRRERQLCMKTQAEAGSLAQR